MPINCMLNFLKTEKHKSKNQKFRNPGNHEQKSSQVPPMLLEDVFHKPVKENLQVRLPGGIYNVSSSFIDRLFHWAP